ncbi:MAG TPA: D-alanine--D-alanine ligase [bacterium]|jgi:D-alanine-D-alanine ligase|nr:D-alanine--D-alanine ligase [Dictyoglomota bacterium]HHV80577.1 D-alanine--D-alanine ligase [bacterium]HOP56250.1 D-alanine--D-alanine ligase [bacterium]HRU33408.1 D-alanine--D-alanine ligase [bacterium]
MDDQQLKDKKIIVLCGWISREREVSLRSGKKIYSALLRKGYDVTLIDPKMEGWEPVLRGDIVFIALHGKPGEDGTIQGFLETFNVPYTGSGVLASSLAMNKLISKKMFIFSGIPTPDYLSMDDFESIDDFISKSMEYIGLPAVVKPVSEGSSIGVSIVKDADSLAPVVKDTVNKFDRVFIEKYIEGREITIGIIELDGKPVALPILELVPRNKFYDYEAKYTAGFTEFIIPARMDKEKYTLAQELALKAHKALGCTGFSRVDLITDSNDNPYVLEVNTIPGMTELSDLPAMAKAYGIDYDDLVEIMLQSALREKV